ncbi:MAG: COX15/CtaA family protein [Candidatus Cohnella colombiensis]|uniref:COX15/CtaA family protein n=1 Tax=Candidatus Cohnella colombiensis TaxID=3121368 RepID=A0AA95EV10_9BACL|nr:MAG: COX15/CtaA family protein [Cohnella sp.]
MTEPKYRLLTLLTCIGMFLVLIAGVLVTNTGSEAGCGTDWPLCNGKFVPAYTLESMVEYTHRAISGIVGLLAGATFLVTRFWKPARTKEHMLYADGTLLFTVLQAILGAMAVVWKQSSLVLALHFGISLIAFTCTWLLYSTVRRKHKESLSLQSNSNHITSKVLSIPKGLFRLIVALLVYCYFVIYLGAYIRHTASAGACEGWPLCNGAIIPEFEGTVGVAFAHRIAALLMLVLVVILNLYIRKTVGKGSELAKLAVTANWLVFLQVLSGGLLTFTLGNENIYVFTGLLHTLLITALFSMLTLLAIRTKQLSR